MRLRAYIKVGRTITGGLDREERPSLASLRQFDALSHPCADTPLYLAESSYASQARH